MKAQILKIAGVKSEKEFYKKYPTEEAFMKKHGHKLKKAKGGITVDEEEEEDGVLGKPFVGIADPYKVSKFEGLGDNLMDVSKNPYMKQSTSNDTGSVVIKDSDAPITTSANVSSGPFNRSTSLIPGLEGYGGLVSDVKLQDDGTYYSALEDKSYMPSVAKEMIKSGEYIDSNDPNMKTPDPYAGLADKFGSALGLFMTAKGKYDEAKKNKVYGEVADLLTKANTMPKQAGRSNVLRPEYQMISPDQLTPALGTGTEYLAAKNGGKFSSGEITNTYAPGDLYEDLGYADFGALLGTAGKIAGKVPTGLAGAIGSRLAGGRFQSSPEAELAGSAGEFLGGLTMIPGADKLGKIALEGITGAIMAPELKQRELNQNKIITSGLAMGQRNFQQANDAFMEDGGHVSDFGYMSDTWNPQVITKFGNMDVSEFHTYAENGMPQYRAGGHLSEYTPPSASAMYTGRDLPYQMDNGGKMAMGGDLQVEQGTIKTLAHNPLLNNGGQIIEFKGPSHENGGMDTRYGDKMVNVEGNETGYVDDQGSFHVLGNQPISKFAAEQIGDMKFAGMKYKKLGKILGNNQSKANKMIDKSTEAIASLDINNPFDQLAINAHMLNIQAGKDETKKNAAMLKMAGMVQDAYLSAADEHGLDPAALSEYKIKKVNKKDQYAEFGAKLKMAKNGIKMDAGGNTSPADKFKQFEEEVNARLRKLAQETPGMSPMFVLPNTKGVYNSQGGRDISSQAGIYKKGYSKTPVSLHNFDAARDYQIYQRVLDPRGGGYVYAKLSPGTHPELYADVLWPVAEKLGMYHVGDRDPKTKDTNWDPAHIGLVKEGQGTAYKELTEKYPSIFDTPNAKKTVKWIIDNKNKDPEIKRHYDMLMSAKPKPSTVEKIVNTVSDAIKQVTPTFDTSNWAAKAVGEFIGATNELKDAIPTPNKLKDAIRTPEIPKSFRFWEDDEEEVAAPVETPAKAAAPTVTPQQYKIRPKGEKRSAVVQTSPTSGVVKPAVNAAWNQYLNPKLPQPGINFREKDSWADDGSAFWKPILGVPQDFPNTKGSTSLIGKNYDPGYEQSFWKPKDFRYTPSGPLTETRTVTQAAGAPATQTAQPATTTKGKGKGKGKGKAAATTTPAAQVQAQVKGTPAPRTVRGQDYLTDGSMPPEAQAQTVDQGMLNQVAPDTNPNNALNLQPVGGNYSGFKSPGTAATAKGDSNLGRFFDAMLSNAAPFLRPTNQLGLDPAQLSSEMLALSNNAVEPVFAQTYQPMLTQPIDVSYQDQLNEITAQSRAAERLTQGNPELQANIFAQSAQAKNKVLAEQFRANQAEKLRAYETNRQTLNDAQLKNLAILDQQYQRQSQAKSNTKAQTLAAINSISDKLAKNKLENKTLATYENMYNYRFTPQGVAYNVNGPQNFNIPTVGTGADDVDSIIQNLDKQKELIDAAKSKLSKTTKATNGGIVKAINSL